MNIYAKVDDIKHKITLSNNAKLTVKNNTLYKISYKRKIITSYILFFASVIYFTMTIDIIGSSILTILLFFRIYLPSKIYIGDLDSTNTMRWNQNLQLTSLEKLYILSKYIDKDSSANSLKGDNT